MGSRTSISGEHGTLVNHLIQALKAESLYKRGVEYEIVEGDVMIIDEFTGRILEGRRWSEGLHQADRGEGGSPDPRGEPDARHDHSPELLPALRQALRHDGHGADRGPGVHEDLQASRRSRFRPTWRWSGPTRTTRSTRPRTASGRPSSRRSSGATRSASRSWSGTISVETSEMLADQLKRRGDRPRRAQRQARARPARGRDDRPGGPQGRGHHRHQHGGARRGHQARR